METEFFADRTRLMGTENAFKIGPHILRAEAGGQKVIRLNLGEPDGQPPEWVTDTVIDQIRAGNTKYCDPQGLPSLRQAIADSAGRDRGLEISPDQVCVFPGGKPSIAFTQQLYCNPGDEIIYPSPGFPIYESMVRYLGAVPVPLHLKEAEEFTFGPDQLRELISPKTKLIILNFPSNPTGGVADMAQLEALAEVILSRCRPEVRIYSDEIYENILFGNQAHASIASVPGMADKTLVASGFSKSFAWTGGRIGYIICPTVAEAMAFKRLNINYFSCIPPFNQEGARAALEDPRSPAWMASNARKFEERAHRVVDLLNDIPGVSCRLPKGAFYAFPNIEGLLCRDLGAMEAAAALSKTSGKNPAPATLFQMFALYAHGVAVLDRNAFGTLGVENQHYLRLSLASSLPELEQGVARLAAAGSDRSGFRNFISQREIPGI